MVWSMWYGRVNLSDSKSAKKIMSISVSRSSKMNHKCLNVNEKKMFE